MRIGLIDVDAESRGKITFPNLALMKVSAWHKVQGDSVEWYKPMLGHFDRVYLAKVFGSEYTKDYEYPIDADEIIRGGSGYAITVRDGRECYDKTADPDLPEEIDHIMPDYSLYGITDTAYGFLTKGCPRACDFCHVVAMQGRAARTVATLDEFWDGQKSIKLLDPNITASRDWEKHFKALADSKAYVDFTQGLDARLLTIPKIEALNDVNWKRIHFAWDKPEEDLRGDFERIAQHLKGLRKQTTSAYVLTNFGSTFEQDVERVMFLRSLNIMRFRTRMRRKELNSERNEDHHWHPDCPDACVLAGDVQGRRCRVWLRRWTRSGRRAACSARHTASWTV